MCGLFGFIGSKIDVGLATDAALLAETRGPHAFGFAWRGDNALEILRYPDRFSNHKDSLARVAGTNILIGLCRLSTSGTPKDNQNNQPVVIDDNLLVHNGNVHTFKRIFQDYNYTPTTACDSEALLLLSLKTDVSHAVATVGAHSPLAAAFLFPDSLVLAAYNHPLYLHPTQHGTYFCSRRMTPHATLLRTIKVFPL